MEVVCSHNYKGKLWNPLLLDLFLEQQNKASIFTHCIAHKDRTWEHWHLPHLNAG